MSGVPLRGFRVSGIPPVYQEPLKRAAVATALAMQTAFLVLVGAAAQAGSIGTPGDLWDYVTTHWWGVAIGFVLPAAYRARQGISANNDAMALRKD